jgi:hypothetical protein
MEGTIQNSGRKYWWWAGPANDGAREGFCVHCRNATFGVTKYVDAEPSEQEARGTAESLIPKVDALH